MHKVGVENSKFFFTSIVRMVHHFSKNTIEKAEHHHNIAQVAQIYRLIFHPVLAFMLHYISWSAEDFDFINTWKHILLNTLATCTYFTFTFSQMDLLRWLVMSYITYHTLPTPPIFEQFFLRKKCILLSRQDGTHKGVNFGAPTND